MPNKPLLFFTVGNFPHHHWKKHADFFFFICSEFCHTLKWISHEFTCVPHPDPPSHLPLHALPLGFPSACWFQIRKVLLWAKCSRTSRNLLAQWHEDSHLVLSWSWFSLLEIGESNKYRIAYWKLKYECKGVYILCVKYYYEKK